MLSYRPFENNSKIPDFDWLKKWLSSWENGETTIKSPNQAQVRAVGDKVSNWGPGLSDFSTDEFDEIVIETGGEPSNFYISA